MVSSMTSTRPKKVSRFSKLLRAHLKKTELTQVWLSTHADISKKTISRYANGLDTPEPETLERILETLCVPKSKRREWRLAVVRDKGWLI